MHGRKCADKVTIQVHSIHGPALDRSEFRPACQSLKRSRLREKHAPSSYVVKSRQQQHESALSFQHLGVDQAEHFYVTGGQERKI
jgi:hypothetical protein